MLIFTQDLTKSFLFIFMLQPPNICVALFLVYRPQELLVSLCDKVSNRACCADAGSYKVTYIRN